MEFVLVSGIIGLGYVFSKNQEARFTKKKIIGKTNKHQIPSGNNIYENKRSQEVWNDQQQRANEIFSKSKNSLESNYMIAGPPVPIFNKVDGTENKLPLEFTSSPELKENVEKVDQQLSKQIYHPNIDPAINDLTLPYKDNDYMAAGGWGGISLTGNTINPKDFLHNNMTPFFGSSVRQNVDEYANRATLENFTGQMDNYMQKQEVKRDDLFMPVANLTNPYGYSNLDGYNYDRYIVSNKRNNEAPVEPIRVGPGLNDGFTWKPSGGFQQEKTREAVLPKNVDELRVKTNPKVSFEGRIVPGKHIAKPGKVGEVHKNTPDTFYVNTPDRLFTTVGETTGPRQRPDIVMKFTNRKTTELKSRVGPVAPAEIGSQQQMRPAFRKSAKFNYAGAGPRNSQAQGQWGITGPNAQIPNDYGRSSMKVRPNMRQKTGGKMQISNFSAPNKVDMPPNNPNVRPTKKTNVIGNPRPMGNFQNTGPYKPKVYDPNDIPRTTIKETNINNNRAGNFQSTGPYKQQVYDPNDVTRTTIKETNINNNRMGNFQSSGPYKQQVYDPNDVTRTTIKETNINNKRMGNFQSSGPYKQQVYDPNDVTRTTIKETNINNNRMGNFQSSGPYKQQVYDPNDVTRTTIKETNINNNRMGNFQSSGPYKQQVYDPNDVARTTIKETNINNNRVGGIKGPNHGKVYNPKQKLATTIKETTILQNNMGNIDRQKNGGGYKIKNMEAKNTNRQTTSVEYMGDPKGENKGGYQVANVEAKTTSRQFMTDHEYSGAAGPAEVHAPMSYSDIYNATIKSIRQDVAKGRPPIQEGPKVGISKETINMKTNKNVDQTNQQIQERGQLSTKVYNSVPQPQQFGKTHHKDTLPNKPLADRINPSILDAFKKNPYTQSLESYAFP